MLLVRNIREKRRSILVRSRSSCVLIRSSLVLAKKTAPHEFSRNFRPVFPVQTCLGEHGRRKKGAKTALLSCYVSTVKRGGEILLPLCAHFASERRERNLSILSSAGAFIISNLTKKGDTRRLIAPKFDCYRS